ncbi:hypothetical protein CFE70_007597 [Pyrenophora teres f. teres 0-1]|uniref:FAD-binding domain-containing protein n=1 Tax=Pyrenophora teres f. teres (strain 0-1) TaxID=861557 RepID=E3S0Z9_PYRTT|nr:hypothetical protein PTT_15808 [Pyrenophora teres f. teres 0-1]KAE8844003.1 hypothetical protein HRS9122_05106 [Pyrenophora teres f. teres]KAE8858941.1 hypothetical protein PTNB73_08421 [Pyrenophora teres f. teres]
MSHATTYDIVIAGAGPVGLFLACELALTNVSVLVLEKSPSLEDPWRDGPLGFRLLSHGSTEIFHRRGILDKVIARELTPGETTLSGGKPEANGTGKRQRQPGDFPVASHFAGILVMSKDVNWDMWRHVLPGPSAFGGALKQGQLVGVLWERAKELGVEVRLGWEIVRFADTGYGVKVWATNHGGDGNEEEFEAKYLVGADGGRSFVRQHAGFTMEGNEASWTGYMADCELEAKSKEALTPGFHRTQKGAYASRHPTAFVLDFDNKGDASRARRPEVTREVFESVLRRVVGRDELAVDSLNLGGSFIDRAKLVTQYRRGRILVAGDAAHIHSPLGGQGLNLGLAEAFNLGWKLGAVVKGLAPEGVLDTYDKERRPIAAEVLEMIRAHTAAIEPGLHGDAVFNLAKQMIATRDGATLFASKLIWYHPVIDVGGDCKHWLVGRSAPDFAFNDGTRLGEKMQRGAWVVVDFAKDQKVKEWAKKVAGFEYADEDATETLGLCAALIRPDGVVAWARDAAEKDGSALEGLQEAKARWLE